MAAATFRNRKVHQLWAAATVWNLAVAAIWFVLTQDAGLLPIVRVVLLVAFGATALLVGGVALASSTLTVRVLEDRVLLVTRRWPLRKAIRRVEASAVPRADVIEETDNDLDVSFLCRVTLADGTVMDLAESHSRSEIAAEAARFNAAVGTPPFAPAPAGAAGA